MNPTTRSTLDELNRAFYISQAAAFSKTRQAPWPGWNRALQALPSTCGSTRVLDVGCGNGRLASFLVKRVGGPLAYLGLDRSQELLTLARQHKPSPGSELRFECRDFTAGRRGVDLPSGPFDWIALFGVLHHLPGFSTRRALLRGLAERLAAYEQPRLVISVWRFGAFERFRRRILPWSEYNLRAEQPIDTEQLEPGDVLLRWGEGDGAQRYCHFVDDDELARLLDGLPLEVLDQYDADGRSGRSNRYLILGRQKSENERESGDVP